MFGLVCAVMSAVAFAANDTALRRGILFASVYKSIIVTVPIGLPVFLLAITLTNSWSGFRALDPAQFLFFGSAGIIHFIFGRYFGYKTIESVGATQAGPIVQLGLLISVFFAYHLFDEEITNTHIIAIFLIILAPMIILLGHEGDKFTRSGIEMKYKAGLFWGLSCAICYGISPLLVKSGFSNYSLEITILAGFISYISAIFSLILIMTFTRVRIRDVIEMDKSALKWFTITGFLGSSAQLLRYIALGLIPISIVEPIHRTSVIFRVVFGFIINRNHEIINLRVLLGVALSIIGMYLLILQIDF
ncbi:MAG: EamA family transporter [Pseudomonadota bacterium]|nr:EamA family transporter [Pseudomonadota bacterium]